MLTYAMPMLLFRRTNGRFGKASKHCSKCGKASTKVDRPSCKSCGATEWNFEGVSKDESSFLATAQVARFLHAAGSSERRCAAAKCEAAQLHAFSDVVLPILCTMQANATSRAKMMNSMEGSDDKGDQVVVGSVAEALSACKQAFQAASCEPGAGRTYELRGLHLGSGVAAGKTLDDVLRGFLYWCVERTMLEGAARGLQREREDERERGRGDGGEKHEVSVV